MSYCLKCGKELNEFEAMYIDRLCTAECWKVFRLWALQHAHVFQSVREGEPLDTKDYKDEMYVAQDKWLQTQFNAA